MLPFLIQTQKRNFWSICGSLPQTSQNNNFVTMFHLMFGLYDAVTSHIKIRKMHQLAIKDSFWLPFVQNPRARFSSKKSFWVNYKPLCCCTSWKYQKTHALTFNNTCKPLFRSILDPFGTISSQKSYFQKNIFHQFIFLYCCK